MSQSLLGAVGKWTRDSLGRLNKAVRSKDRIAEVGRDPQPGPTKHLSKQNQGQNNREQVQFRLFRDDQEEDTESVVFRRDQFLSCETVGARPRNTDSHNPEPDLTRDSLEIQISPIFKMADKCLVVTGRTPGRWHF